MSWNYICAQDGPPVDQYVPIDEIDAVVEYIPIIATVEEIKISATNVIEKIDAVVEDCDTAIVEVIDINAEIDC